MNPLRVRTACSLLLLASLAGCDESLGDIQGPHSARVGETVTVTSEGTLRSKPGDISLLTLMGYDDGELLGEIVITKVELDGGTELKDREEPPLRDEWGINTSNVIHIRHDRRAVHYTATAEVTCVAPGEVRSEERPDVLFGLEWDYSDGDSGGNLNRAEAQEAFPFTCEE